VWIEIFTGAVAAIVADGLYKQTNLQDVPWIEHYHVGMASLLLDNRYADGFGATLIGLEFTHSTPFTYGEDPKLTEPGNTGLAILLGAGIVYRRVLSK
jgi:hypothetical protein